jgi:hypothetical protein
MAAVKKITGAYCPGQGTMGGGGPRPLGHLHHPDRVLAAIHDLLARSRAGQDENRQDKENSLKVRS